MHVPCWITKATDRNSKMQYLVLFRGNSGYGNAFQYRVYVSIAYPLLLKLHHRPPRPWRGECDRCVNASNYGQRTVRAFKRLSCYFTFHIRKCLYALRVICTFLNLLLSTHCITFLSLLSITSIMKFYYSKKILADLFLSYDSWFFRSTTEIFYMVD
jgi:hypothetical protein